MAINNPPMYRYPLEDAWMRESFEYFRRVGKSKEFPKVIGIEEDKNQFLITLIRTQKSIHGYEEILEEMLQNIYKTNTIDTKYFNEKYPASIIGKDTPAWAVYQPQIKISKFIDELETRKISFEGTEAEMSEFILRFILGQLGSDWEWTIAMIQELLGDDEKISLRELNLELRNFDYSKLFD